MNVQELPKGIRLVIEAMQEKKASAITVLDLSGIGSFTEYFVVCTGFSTPQVQAICTEIEEQLYKEMNREPQHREGRRSADWALLDFGGFVVHVFSEQARRYYDLERLWRNVPRYDIPDRPDSFMSGHTAEPLRASGERS